MGEITERGRQTDRQTEKKKKRKKQLKIGGVGGCEKEEKRFGSVYFPLPVPSSLKFQHFEFRSTGYIIEPDSAILSNSAIPDVQRHLEFPMRITGDWPWEKKIEL